MVRSEDVLISIPDGPAGLAPLLARLVETVVLDLDLAGDLSAVAVVADDFPEPGGAWFSFAPGTAGDPRPALQLFCHPERFCRPSPRTRTILPEREIWEQAWSPTSAPGFDVDEFSSHRSGQFLYHNLLTAQDLVRGDLPRDGIGSDRIEAFSAVWAVTVDGRLERAGHGGYDLAERRGRFSRLFSTAGVLLPDHWQIFQSLWDGGLAGWREVLAVTDRLPRIRPQNGV